MMRTNKPILVICILGLLTLMTCDLPHQPGPMPREIVETEFEPGLNIIGVLRADGQQGSSFININRALTTEEIYSDTIEAFSPETDHVSVIEANGDVEYLFLREDATDWGDYRDTTLIVTPGETYTLEIVAQGYPMLTGSTSVPFEPVIKPGSLNLVAGELFLELEHHAGSFEYKLYLIFNETIQERIVKPSSETVIPVEWTFSEDHGLPLVLVITALDENLTRYSNSPISFIPNTYHADGSTVTGGYGCFGSVSVLTHVF